LLAFPPLEGEGDVIGRWRFYLSSLDQMNLGGALMGIGAFAAIMLLRGRYPRLPAFLIVVGIASLLIAFGVSDAPSIGTRFGGVPAGLPELRFPEISIGRMGELLPSAFT